jgi:histidinol-phosphate aminotransferase
MNASMQTDDGTVVSALLREDLRDFGGYRSARVEGGRGRIWLNANESAWANAADPGARLRRYPQPQPEALRHALADLYGCRPGQLLAGRGSDEGIDLLLRALCRPGRDAVLVTSPTFGMYAVAARLHGTAVVDVPLREGADGLACEFDAVAAAAEQHQARIVLLCSPGNPTGNLLPLDGIHALARRLQSRALVVVDEAYIEYAQASSAVSLVDAQPNLAVLRTLSKAHALAAARIGCVIGAPGLIAALQRCQAPYPLPTPCVRLAQRALNTVARRRTAARVARTVAERERMQAALSRLPGAPRVYPSHANFLLARLARPQAALQALVEAAIVVRDLRHLPGLGDALRISLGTPAQNDAVLRTLARVAA